MLIEFKVQNFRSIREEQTLSMVASASDKLSGNLIELANEKFLKTAAIYGSNASGKSNLVKAFMKMEELVRLSASNMNRGDPIDLSPFRLDAESRNKPTIFSVTVLIGETIYEYGFSATNQRFISEHLSVKQGSKNKSRWFQRDYKDNLKAGLLSFRGPLEKLKSTFKEPVRENALLLSEAIQRGNTDLVPLYDWFNVGVYAFDFSFPPYSLSVATAERWENDPGLRMKIENFVKDADFGIEGISVKEEQLNLNLFNDAPSEIKDFLKKSLPKTTHRIATLHSGYNCERAERFDLVEDESNGTQRFFAMAGPLIDALENGHLLIIDEIDCSMHALLLRKVLNIIQSAENRYGAQLIFTTHDTNVMDSSLLRKDQIWFTEKNNCGATELYSLSDHKGVRANEAFEKNYLSGRYGAIPMFGPELEFIED